MEVRLNEIQISDLFFNYEKPALEEYFKNANEPDVYSDDARQALRQDAENFSVVIGGQLDAVWLCREYFDRL